MAENSVRQRVAAILAADAVGYSRLMAEDEPATIDALDAARAVFIEHIEANQGRVVDTAGDSVLAAAQRAVEIDPSSQTTHWHLARTHFWRNEVDEAITEAERALVLNPNNAFVLAAAGVYMTPTSPAGLERGVALTEKAMKIDPNPPGWYHVANILSLYQSRDYEAARQAALRMNLPGFYHTHMWRLAIYGELGRNAAAADSKAKLLALYPSFAENARNELEKFNVYPELAEHLVEGWEKGGLFDEPEPEATRP
jgi:tetratricopeptide (TPR) repeat protein